MISYLIIAYALFLSALIIHILRLRLRLVEQGKRNVKAFRELAEYYKSKSYARPVSTNIGEISEEAFERHIEWGEAYSINGKIIIKISPARVTTFL